MKRSTWRTRSSRQCGAAQAPPFGGLPRACRGCPAIFPPFRETHTESITFDGSVDPKAVAELSAKASHTEYKDAAAIGGGAVAVVLALVTLAFWRSTQREKRAMRIGLTLVILALGAYQLIVRGGLLT